MATPNAFKEPPVWMPEEGREEWLRLVPLLGDELMERDLGAFEMLCAQYATLKQASLDIAQRGPLVRGRTKDKSADDEDGEGNERPALVKNPAVQIAREALEKYLKLAQEFGLTPAARQRMKLEVKKGRQRSGPAPAID